MSAILIRLECGVLEVSAGVLPWATCLEIAGSGGIRPGAHMYFLTIWFQRERDEALLSVAIIGHVLWSMVKSDTGNGMEAEFLMTSDAARCVDVNHRPVGNPKRKV
jgi:hypothetical protein